MNTRTFVGMNVRFAAPQVLHISAQSLSQWNLRRNPLPHLRRLREGGALAELSGFLNKAMVVMVVRSKTQQVLQYVG